jgi:hypothetical protein
MAAPLTSGQWSFVGLFLAATLAFILSVSSVAFCDFAERNVRLTATATALCHSHSASATDAEAATTTSRAACQVLSALNHSVGFFGFYAPMPGSDGYTCFSYTQVLKRAFAHDCGLCCEQWNLPMTSSLTAI